MKQEITERHDLDASGTPTGGRTDGTGIDITWQNGSMGRGPDRVPPNGAFVEGVIQAARGRLVHYQTASDGRFACEENAQAIEHLEAALGVLEERTRKREARQVEGTHAP